MKKIIVDADLRAKLLDLQELIELRDENGRVVGYVSPVPWDGEESEIPFSEQELAEIMSQPDGGRPLADILADLEKIQ